MAISAKQAVAPAKGAGGDRGATLGETWWWKLIGSYMALNRSILAYLQKILLQGVIKSFRRGLHSVDWKFFCCCVQQIYSSCEKLRQKHLVACNVWNARILRRSGKLTVPSFLDWSANRSPLFFWWDGSIRRFWSNKATWQLMDSWREFSARPGGSHDQAPRKVSWEWLALIEAFVVRWISKNLADINWSRAHCILLIGWQLMIVAYTRM